MSAASLVKYDFIPDTPNGDPRAFQKLADIGFTRYLEAQEVVWQPSQRGEEVIADTKADTPTRSYCTQATTASLEGHKLSTVKVCPPTMVRVEAMVSVDAQNCADFFLKTKYQSHPTVNPELTALTPGSKARRWEKIFNAPRETLNEMEEVKDCFYRYMKIGKIPEEGIPVIDTVNFIQYRVAGNDHLILSTSALHNKDEYVPQKFDPEAPRDKMSRLEDYLTSVSIEDKGTDAKGRPQSAITAIACVAVPGLRTKMSLNSEVRFHINHFDHYCACMEDIFLTKTLTV